MGRLQDKVALITGTGQGTGRAAALLFAAEGAQVVGCDLNADTSEETLALVRRAGGRMTSTHPLDVTDRDAVRAWVDAAARAFGRIDVLFNNAAAPRFGPFESISVEDWQFTFRHEVDVVFHATQAAWPHLKKHGGSIINMASQSGLMGDEDFGQAAHAAAKAAVIGLTRQLAAEGARHRIRANAISPGVLKTPAALWPAELQKQIEATIPLNRVGRPEDIAPCALFLASDESSFATAGNFVVDGGKTQIMSRWASD